MAINPSYALQFQKLLNRSSEPKKTRVTGTVTAVSADSAGKIKNATISTGNGLLSIPVPYGSNVYTGMVVSAINDGTPSNAQWRLYGTTSLPGGLQGGSIVNHDGNTFAMFDSIWVRGDGVVIVGGDVGIDGEPTGPRVESNECGYFGYDQYDRRSLAIYAANCDGYYAGDVLLGPEEGSRISVLPNDSTITISRNGAVSLEFAPDGNFIREALTIGNPVGARIDIGEIEDKATLVMRDKHGVAKLVARTDDTDNIYVHIGNPPPEDNSLWFDSTDGVLNVNGSVTMQSGDVRGRITFASTGSFRIEDPDDPHRYGVISPRGIYAYSIDSLGQQYLASVDAWGPLTLENRPGSGVFKTWLAGEVMRGDPDYRHMRYERGPSGRLGMFNGDTPVVYVDANGRGYFSGGGEFTGTVEITDGALVWGGGIGRADSTGLYIHAWETTGGPSLPNYIRFVDDDQDTVAWLGALYSTVATASFHVTDARGRAINSGTSIQATSDVGKMAYAILTAYHGTSDDIAYIEARSGTDNVATVFVSADAINMTGNGYWRPATNSATALQLQNAAGTAIVTVDTSNSRFILGSTVPIMAGSDRFVHRYGTSNFFAGTNAGNFTTSGTGGNIGIGPSSLSALTTGYYNIGIGLNALEDLTDGNGNVALGGYAGRNLTTGYGNFAFGYFSLQAATDAIYNIAIGAEAMSSYNPGSSSGRNIAIGAAALGTITSGVNNVVIGTASGYSNNGSGNVFIGHNAGQNETGDSKLIIDSQWRTNEAGQRIGAPIYAEMSTTLTSQLVRVNGVLQSLMTDSATNTATTQIKISHNTSGTVDNGLGSRVLFELQSSTDTNQTAAAIDAAWLDKTHASRTGMLKFYGSYTGTLYEGLRVGAVSGAAALGFYGVTAIARPTTGYGTASFTANSGTAINDASTFDGYTIKQIVKALRDLGLLT